MRGLSNSTYKANDSELLVPQLPETNDVNYNKQNNDEKPHKVRTTGHRKVKGVMSIVDCQCHQKKSRKLRDVEQHPEVTKGKMERSGGGS